MAISKPESATAMSNAFSRRMRSCSVSPPCMTYLRTLCILGSAGPCPLSAAKARAEHTAGESKHAANALRPVARKCLAATSEGSQHSNNGAKLVRLSSVTVAVDACPSAEGNVIRQESLVPPGIRSCSCTSRADESAETRTVQSRQSYRMGCTDVEPRWPCASRDATTQELWTGSSSLTDRCNLARARSKKDPCGRSCFNAVVSSVVIDASSLECKVAASLFSVAARKMTAAGKPSCRVPCEMRRALSLHPSARSRIRTATMALSTVRTLKPELSPCRVSESGCRLPASPKAAGSSAARDETMRLRSSM